MQNTAAQLLYLPPLPNPQFRGYHTSARTAQGQGQEGGTEMGVDPSIRFTPSEGVSWGVRGRWEREGGRCQRWEWWRWVLLAFCLLAIAGHASQNASYFV